MAFRSLPDTVIRASGTPRRALPTGFRLFGVLGFPISVLDFRFSRRNGSSFFLDQGADCSGEPRWEGTDTAVTTAADTTAAGRAYVPVAVRRQRAMKKMAALRKKASNVQPVEIDGRKIAHSFWGEAWCEHLESFSDFENRLPRGRTYVRNGSVCHLAVAKGHDRRQGLRFGALRREGGHQAAGRQEVEGDQGPLQRADRLALGTAPGAAVGRGDGAWSPTARKGSSRCPAKCRFHCSCPDWASMCKHVAAVLYGVGSRLDSKPELLFLLRGVNHEELIAGRRREGRPRRHVARQVQASGGGRDRRRVRHHAPG